MATDNKQPALILTGAIALILGSVLLVGVDYRETRERAAVVPLNTQRIQSVEIAIKDGAKRQAEATDNLTQAVQELRETIAEMRGRHSL